MKVIESENNPMVDLLHFIDGLFAESEIRARAARRLGSLAAITSANSPLDRKSRLISLPEGISRATIS